MKIWPEISACTLLACLSAVAQSPQAAFQSAGGFNAAAFGQYSLPVTTPVAAAGTASITVFTAYLTLPSGPAYQPLAASAPLLINDGANTETVTPTAVTCSAGTCSVTASFALAHPGNFSVASATGGLQEALVWSHQHGGGKVVLGPGFSVSGTSVITAATGTSDTVIEDNRSGGQVLYAWTGSAYAPVTAQGPGGLSIGAFPLTVTVANAGTTGTTLNKLAKLTGAPSTALISGTSDTAAAIGVVVAGAGTSGSASIAVGGIAACIFDASGVTAGHYVQISAASAGDCKDGGATTPASGEVVGVALQTVASGAANVLLFPTRF